MKSVTLGQEIDIVAPSLGHTPKEKREISRVKSFLTLKKVSDRYGRRVLPNYSIIHDAAGEFGRGGFGEESEFGVGADEIPAGSSRTHGRCLPEDQTSGCHQSRQ